MGLEDAATLAECLERAENPQDIPQMLKALQEIRQPRCKRVQEWSGKKGQRATLPDGPEQEKRDEDLKLFNAWVEAEPWDKVHVDEIPALESPVWKAWLNGHDAVGFVSYARLQSYLYGRTDSSHRQIVNSINALDGGGHRRIFPL